MLKVTGCWQYVHPPRVDEGIPRTPSGMSNISPAARAAQEQSRRTNGEFGEQQHEAPAHDLPSSAAPTPAVDLRAGDVIDMARVADAYFERNPEDEDDLRAEFTAKFGRGPRRVERIDSDESTVSIWFGGTDPTQPHLDGWEFPSHVADTDDPDWAPRLVEAAPPPATAESWAAGIATKLRADPDRNWSRELAELDAIQQVAVTKDARRRRAVAAFEELAAEHPDAAYDTYAELERTVRDAEYPQLKFRPGDPDNGEEGVFIDPYTGQETEVRAVDRSERWTDIDAVDVDAEEQTIQPDYDSTADYDGFVYQSTSTGKPVRLPDGWSER